MHIAYFDEVKYQPPGQPYYWLCAIVATPESIWAIENQLSEVSEECFGEPALTRDTEFHAAELFHRKRNFKQWSSIDRRLDLLKRLIQILEQSDVGKIKIRIDPAKMIKRDYEEMAFVFLVERVERYLRRQKSPGILIGDRENDAVSGKFSEMLSQYRASGTPYSFGIELKHLIDTVHFTDSHHSRMIQAADLFVWINQLCARADDKYPSTEIVEYVKKQTQLLRPDSYKCWPPTSFRG